MRLTWSAPIMPAPTMPTRKSWGGSAVVIVTPVCLRGCLSVKLCGSAVGGPIGEARWSPVDDGRLGGGQDRLQRPLGDREGGVDAAAEHVLDRKSTRLNSSHVSNSYAVFC